MISHIPTSNYNIERKGAAPWGPDSPLPSPPQSPPEAEWPEEGARWASAQAGAGEPLCP